MPTPLLALRTRCYTGEAGLLEFMETGFSKGRHGKMPEKSKSPTKPRSSANQRQARIYTLEVFLIDGMITKWFSKKKRYVSRTIEIRGDQTLEELHLAIFDAFDRFDEHMYEFQFGSKPMDPRARKYVMPEAMEMDFGMGWGISTPPAGQVDQTTIDSLGLTVGFSFGYWFDFGDDWWHQINVDAIDEKVPEGKYPKITKRIGKSPPQYGDDEE